ncbi:peptidoglycan D,D-transpeptidase FtsI family protein [Roseomonas sp. BN140053]|uniref:peptidoglycan D,D-transpeptidase FtsI family protein n=1 Tax=Roseomonas sp. BN140053 TaxID=3391898 RepID=UPI0039ED8A6F
MTGPRAPRPDEAPVGRRTAPPLPRARAATFTEGAGARTAQPDLARRAALERSRGRLVLAAAGFGLLFTAVGLKLTYATLLDPREPRRIAARPTPATQQVARSVARGPITDRNGEILAVSLPVTELVANPSVIDDPAKVADQLVRILPQLDRERLVHRLTGERQFAYIARSLTPRETQAVNNLGVAGLEFHQAERRYYPQGRAAVHVLGNVDVDNEGVSGVERYFNERLRLRPDDGLRLSVDVRVQLALRDAVQQAITDYNGIGGAGVILDINTSEVISMVSLPDYDAGDIGGATPEQRFNRVTVGTYEPGSTMKLITTAMALEAGTTSIYGGFDASRPIRVGRFTISDYRGKNRWLSLPEILAYSSNLGAAHMAATVGPARHREFMGRMGLLQRIHLELPETAMTLAPSANSWREVNTYTIGFGHGISVTPLHMINAIAALANGGILHEPTLIAQPPGAVRDGVRVISQQTSDTIRRLMRIVVTEGSAKSAEVPGYFVGGKTGTAQKTGPRGGYLADKRITAFTGAFPIQAPRYALYVMVDEPKPNARSHGFATAGWVAAPAAGSVIARVAPILGLVPDDPRDPAINAAITVPLQPGRGPATPRVPAQAANTPADAPAGRAPAAGQPAARPAVTTPPRPATPSPATGQNPLRVTGASPQELAPWGPDLAEAR